MIANIYKTGICIILGLIIITNFSCKKQEHLTIESDEDTQLIFGHLYGMCVSETCVETFSLMDNKLFEDTNDIYGGTDFNFVQLGNDKYDKVKNLPDLFPQQLLSETETTFGCPDCYDQGGYYIEYTKNGVTNSWRMDSTLDDIPAYMHDFINEVKESIELINN